MHSDEPEIEIQSLFKEFKNWLKANALPATELYLPRSGFCSFNIGGKWYSVSLKTIPERFNNCMIDRYEYETAPEGHEKETKTP